MFCSSSAFAANVAEISGYSGRMGILSGGGDLLEKGMSFEVSVVNSDDQNISNLNVVWSVSDSSAASITGNGYNAKFNEHDATVKLLKAGTIFSIYATVNGVQLEKECHVIAAPVSATSLTLGNNAVSLNGKGKTAKVNIVVGPENTNMVDGDANPSVTSGNPHIATVVFSHLATGETYFTVTGVANGSTSIYVKTASGPSATCLVTVTGAGKSAPVVTLDTKKYSGKAGHKYIFLAKSNDGTVISAKSNNSAVVKVGKPIRSSKGWLITLTGVKAGTTTITTTSKSGATASFLATVS